MVCRFALRYSCGNDAARDELIDFGLLALQDFFVKHLDELTLESLETDELKVEVHNYLWSKIGHEAEKLSHKSPAFVDFNLKDKNSEAKIAVQFFGYIGEASNSDTENCKADFFDSEIIDEQSYEDTREVELFYDIKRLLSDEEYTLFMKYYNGSTLATLGREYGVSFQAISKRLNRIRKKLIPLGESIMACA